MLKYDFIKYFLYLGTHIVYVYNLHKYKLPGSTLVPEGQEVQLKNRYKIFDKIRINLNFNSEHKLSLLFFKKYGILNIVTIVLTFVLLSLLTVPE